jgi:hypothetical protein
MNVYLGHMQTLCHVLSGREEACHQMMENIYSLARCIIYFRQNTFYCANQTHLVQLPHQPQAWQLLKSTLWNLNEFACDWFQQLVNKLADGCKFSTFFLFCRYWRILKQPNSHNYCIPHYLCLSYLFSLYVISFPPDIVSYHLHLRV